LSVVRRALASDSSSTGDSKPTFYWSVESFDYREAGALCNDYGGQLAVLNTPGALNVAGLNKQVSGASEVTFSNSHSLSTLGKL
jgi:hypothetical protein